MTFTGSTVKGSSQYLDIIIEEMFILREESNQRIQSDAGLGVVLGGTFNEDVLGVHAHLGVARRGFRRTGRDILSIDNGGEGQEDIILVIDARDIGLVVDKIRVGSKMLAVVVLRITIVIHQLFHRGRGRISDTSLQLNERV